MHNIHLTAVSLTIFSSAYAQDFVSKSANSAAVQSALSSISSLEALLVPPSSIASELTGVPASVTSALNDPSQISALQSQFISSLPSWYTALPSEAQAYVVSVGAAAQTIQPQILSLEQVAGVNVAPSTAASGSSTQPGGIMSTASVTGSLTTAAASGSETTSSSQPGGPLSSFSRPTSETGTTGPEQSSSVTATGTAASSSSSSAGAAKATSGPSGAIAVGLMGAMGLFGVAVAL